MFVSSSCQSKYIGKLVEKAKIRAQEQDIVRERLLVKERMQEDHLYKDKEKFVTSAYKKKLAEQAKWLEEERLRELRDKAEDVSAVDSAFVVSRNLSFFDGIVSCQVIDSCSSSYFPP